MADEHVTGSLKRESPINLLAYVGTYANAQDDSIFLYSLNQTNGKLTRMKGFKGGKRPSYFAFDEQRQFMYAVNEQDDYDAEGNGAVCAFAVNQRTGDLALLNRTPSHGALPVYVTLSTREKSVLVANYESGNIAVLPIVENGQLAKASDQKQHNGEGPDKKRQESTHAHCIASSPDGRFIFAVDLGNDSIMRYEMNANATNFLPGSSALAFKATPGTGPRQLRFHPNGLHAYLIHELKSVISVLAYDHHHGTFAAMQTIDTIPSNFQQENKCGGIRITSDGKFLYASNRGHNSLAAYAIDAHSGKLTYLENTPSGGDWPREFTIVDSVNLLLVANQQSGTLDSFSINQLTGRLTHLGYQEKVDQPVFIEVIRWS